MTNPLIAEREDSTKGYSGVSLLESAVSLKDGIEKGDWAEIAMGAVGTALDALSVAMDPFGAILAAGVGWLLEHVGPLHDALDALTGDADQIAAQSETWANVAKELGAIGEDLGKAVEADLQSWTGEAADQYRQRTKDLTDLFAAAQKGSEGAAKGVKTAGIVVASVRMIVRDTIAQLVGHLISWALQVLFTLGIGLTWVVPQVVAAVAKTASTISRITAKLVKALKALVPLLKKAGALFEDVGKALGKLKGGKGPKAEPPPVKEKIGGKGGGDRGIDPKKGGDDATHTSGADGGGSQHGPGDKSPGGEKPPPKHENEQTNTSHADEGGGSKANDKSGPKNDTAKKEGNGDRSAPDESKNYCGDPIDIATGEVVMTHVDATLPGAAADLVLSRTHLSSYTAGRWFGPSWTSTMDQRLEFAADRVRYFAEDGMVLEYPAPGDAPVLPVQGPRHWLHRTADGYRLSLADRELHFAGSRRVLPLTAIEQNGSRTEISYAADGSPVRLRRDDGVELTVGTAHGRIVALGAPGRPPLVRFSYNRLGQLSTVTDFAGRPMSLDYDFRHRIVGWQDRAGTWYRYVYDQAGRCVRAVGAGGYYNASFVYEPGRTRHTDAAGHTWTYRLNDARQLVERIDPLGNSRRYTWNRRDELLSEVDELGRETRFEYQNGELSAVFRPGAPAVRLTPAGDGRVRLRAGEGDDAVERVVPAFDPATTLVGSAMPSNVPDAPDPLEDLPATDPTARPAERDVFGRPRLVHTASGAAARLGWTADGRRAWRLGPDGDRETWVHDAEGRVVEYRDAAGAARRRKYGPFGLVLEETDAAGARTVFTYDGELRLTSVTNPNGLVWRYLYDPAGRLVSETDYDGRRITYGYDPAGRLRRMVNGEGHVIEYKYDERGNVTERHTPDDLTRYEYDALGRMTLAENLESRVQLVRDGTDRVIVDTINGLGVCWYVEGEVHTRRSSSGVDSQWRYDETGRPLSLRIAGHEMTFGYDAADREITRSVDGEPVLQRRFDAEDRLSEEDIAGVGRRSYRYRPDGRLAAVDDPIRPWQLEFDAAGRVREAHGPAGAERFSYDPAGNMTSATAGALPGPRTYERNQLVSAGENVYRADEQGRITGQRDTAESCTFAWDHLDRLRAARTPDGALWTYHYDALGRRFAKRCWATAPGQDAELVFDVRFLWSDMNLVERIEHWPAQGAYRFLTWERGDDDHPVVQVEHTGTPEEAQFRAVVTSPAGTPTEMLDETGALVWQDRSSFWGAPLPDADVSAMPLAFPGQHRDEETGLHYNVFRYYDPRTARYLSQDPLGLAAAPNPVGYVEQPLLAGDPLGLVPSCGKRGPGKKNRPGTADYQKPPPRRWMRDRKNFKHDVDKMSREEFEKFKPKLNEMLKSDKHFFWSGGHKERIGPGSSDKYLGSLEDRATRIAKQHGGNTLEGSLKDNRVKMPGWINDVNDPRKALVEDKWKYASEQWAKNTKNEAHVVFPGNPDKHGQIDLGAPDAGKYDVYKYRREDNVWKTIEEPELRANGIDKFTKYDSETGRPSPYRPTG